MKKVFLVIISFTFLLGLVSNSFAFKEVIQNPGLELGIGYGFGGVALKVGYETALSKNTDLYAFLVFGGFAKSIGLGSQIELPIKVFEERFFYIGISPFLGSDLIHNTGRTNTSFTFYFGGYPLFSFDFSQFSEVPVSLSFGFGPGISFDSEGILLRSYYTLNMSIFLKNLTIQIGSNSKFAGFDFKVKF